jgi:glucose/arabinose dehydrogenase
MLLHIDWEMPMNAVRTFPPPAGRALRASPLLLAAALGTVLDVESARAGAGTVPTNFTDSLVLSGLNWPVGLAPLPDGRMFFVEQFSGRLRLVVNGALAPTDPVITVPDVRNAPGTEQGLLGIAVDPGWPVRPYVYVYYDAASAAFIHIARFTVAGDLTFTGNGALTIDPATRRYLLTTIPDNANNHNGGTMRFGPDGMLYASLGDDAVGCDAQDLTLLKGKILRLDVSNVPAGGGSAPAQSVITPADNPYVGNANPNARLVYTDGLRNPFRFGIDPSNGHLFIGDVGQNNWEEIDRVPGGGVDLGWPLFEGNAAFTTCAGVTPDGMVAPIHQFPNGSGSYAVIGGPIYRPPACALAGTNFPTEYNGDYFFSEYYHGFLRRLKGSGTSWSIAPSVPGQPNASDWGTGFIAVSDWIVGCDAALWYVRQTVGFADNTGEIRRIVHTGSVGVPAPTPRVEFRPPWPSPARGSVQLAYTLERSGTVALDVFDVRGNRVRGLVRPGRQDAGERTWTWDGLDEKGNTASAGMYFARLTVDGREIIRRFPMIR